MSVPCGIPGWGDLLSNYLELSKEFLDDKDLAEDPLTIAEIAGQKLGQERIQVILREVSGRASGYSINHILLAALGAPIYITTNYDGLFEKAWAKVQKEEIQVVVNSSDLMRPEVTAAFAEKRGVLFKIHGSANRATEHLILTRRDYRRHYRANESFFDSIREHMKENQVLFLGFSHKDPEVSRLVEDIIHQYENKKLKSEPYFFSLQFNMREHHPEVFAARGIVALQPPLGPEPIKVEDTRTYGLATALSDLNALKAHADGPDMSLYQDLARARAILSSEVEAGLSKLEGYDAAALATLQKNASTQWIDVAGAALGGLASQGLYLADHQGNIVDYSTPSVLPKAARKFTFDVAERSYFRQAKSFRRPFVSDGDRSKFNDQGTFFICRPILSGHAMQGLLFSACQIGQWDTPRQLAEEFWKKDAALLLIDSNGIALLPPRNEFSPSDPSEPAVGVLADSGANRGYNWDKLLSLSLRDRLIAHVGNSVVPVSLDDDVLKLSSELSLFSVITEVPSTRWKLALSVLVSTTVT